MIHPKKDERGNPVRIESPSTPSPTEDWNDKSKVSTTTPNHSGVPESINGVEVKPWSTPKDWRDVEGQGSFKEPEFTSRDTRKSKASGVIMVEPGNRENNPGVWVVHPSNQFGGYSATFPKGRLDMGLNSRENAIKEAHEESGLKAHLFHHLGDFERTTTHTRFYLGKRTGGHPSDMGWESQAVSLVPLDQIHNVVTHPSDQPIVSALRKHYGVE